MNNKIPRHSINRGRLSELEKSHVTKRPLSQKAIETNHKKVFAFLKYSYPNETMTAYRKRIKNK